jgi:predicted DNA-binding transcriptional regulator AlpA
MQNVTRKMIEAAVRADDTTTAQERVAIRRAINAGSEPDRIPAREARARLGVSRTTFWRRVKTGQYGLRLIREGHRSVFVLVHELDAIIQGGARCGM